MRVVCTIIVLAAMGLSSFAADITVDVLKVKTSPLIDGKLDDALWQRGTWYTGFRLLNKPDVMMDVQTHFKVAADDSALYFAVRADEPDMANQLKTVTEHDGKVYHDECIEVMMGADPDGSRYLHLIVNPLGTLYDAEIFNEGNESSQAWDGDITVGVATQADAWTLELRVPLLDVGVTEKGKDGWIVNVARERRTGDIKELSSFSPLTGGFHQPSKYIALKLPSIDMSRFLWSVRYPFGFEFKPKDASLTCSAKTHIKNQTGVSHSVVIRPKWVIDEIEAVGSDVSCDLEDGQGREVAFSFPVMNQGRGTLIVEVRDEQNPETVLAVRKRQLELTYMPIRVEVLQPWYRNAIYATESIREIHALARLSVPAEKRVNAQVWAALAPVDAPNDHVTEASFPASHEVDITLPLPDLVPGRYVLAVELRRGGNTLERSETPIRKLEAVAHEWRLDKNNVLLHNGTPFLPLGWFSMPFDDMAELDCPYTVTHDYDTYYYSIEEVRKRWDALAAAGKFVTTYPYPGPKMLKPAEVWGKPLSDDEAKALRERVRALKDHSGLFAWYMADEPELRPALPERMTRIYEIVTDEDPFHPCIMLNDTISGIYKYIDGSDVLMPDPYPCFLQDGPAATPIEKVTSFMKACRDASNARRASWITPQAFNYGDYGRDNNREPTFTELRNMTYQAVIQGTKGFLYFTWSHSRNYMGVQVGVPFLAREAADLKRAILAPDAENLVEVDADAPKHMFCTVRNVGDHVYLFTVNTDTKPQKVRFTLEDKPQGLDELYLVSEDRSLRVAQDGSFSDLFDAYATHIYTSDESVAQRETIGSAQAKISKLDAARKRPGNLAFEDNGTSVTVSSESKYGSTPNRLIDGVRGGMVWRDGTSGRYPDWAEIAWPESVTTGRVVIFSDTVQEAAVLTPDGEDWREVAAVTGAHEAQVTLTFPAVTTDRLRIEIRKNRPDEKYTRITDIEVYAK